MGTRWFVLALVVASIAAAAPARAAGGIKAHTIVKGLDHPAAFDVAPNGDIFYGERVTGEIRIWIRDRDRTVHFLDIPRLVASVTSGTGLLAVTLDPAYPDTPYVYVVATRRSHGVVRTQLLRIQDEGGTGTHLTVLFGGANTPSGDQHNGAKIVFGPDGMLYLTIGEGDVPARAQDVDSPLGKVLRLSLDGSVPPDNPLGPESPVFAFGIRNSFGMVFDPTSGDLWLTDNGPECNDEVDRIRGGENYGWGPNATCSTPPAAPRNTSQDGPTPLLPELYFGDTVGITGAAFCDGCSLGRRSEGTLFFGDFNGGRIHRAILTENRRSIERASVVFTHLRPVLSVEAAPGGGLYFSDSKGLYRLVAP
jgi:glucose/arabinose dehydrogenase